MKEHCTLILEYLHNQLQILRQTISNVDARIRNYLIITGLIWGVVLQSSRHWFILLANSKSIFYSGVLFFLFAVLNIVLMIALIRILSVFSRLKFSIPHFIEESTMLKNVNYRTNISDDVAKDFIINYHKAVKKNIDMAKERNSVFIGIRWLLYSGIGLFVIYSFVLGVGSFTNKNIMLSKMERGRFFMFDDEKEKKPEKEPEKEPEKKPEKEPDEEIRPSMQGDPEIIKLGEAEEDSN